MILLQEELIKFMNYKGWSQAELAKRLNLDISYVNRVINGKRGIGKKFVAGLIILCREEGLNFFDFIEVT